MYAFSFSLSLEVAWVVINSACLENGLLRFKFQFLYLLDTCLWTGVSVFPPEKMGIELVSLWIYYGED